MSAVRPGLAEAPLWQKTYLFVWLYVRKHVDTTPTRGGADFYFRPEGGGADWPLLTIFA